MSPALFNRCCADVRASPRIAAISDKLSCPRMESWLFSARLMRDARRSAPRLDFGWSFGGPYAAAKVLTYWRSILSQIV